MAPAVLETIHAPTSRPGLKLRALSFSMSGKVTNRPQNASSNTTAHTAKTRSNSRFDPTLAIRSTDIALLSPPQTPKDRRPSAECSSSSPLARRGRSYTPSSPNLHGTFLAMKTKGEVAQDMRESRWEAIRRPREFVGSYELDPNAREFGHGAWSSVCVGIMRAENKEPENSGLISPPSSPQFSNNFSGVVAVKRPVTQDAVPVLTQEAMIQTFLQPKAPSFMHPYLATFYGFDMVGTSLIFEALPITLASYSEKAAAVARKNFSTQTMFAPVVGTSHWLHIASGLVKGLQYLHNNGVVHGDIKPANILLRLPNDGKGNANYNPEILPEPVYCDFSSSHFLTQHRDPEEISAVTTAFTAPELLEGFHKRAEPGKAIATFKSDIYSLGVSLLTPAIGSDVYQGARLEMQRLVWAREGKPLDYARSSDQATRVMKNGIVDRILAGAVTKAAADRWDLATWTNTVDEIREKGK
ncbi:MAG: hypothetical protein M1824_001986 [Vezdaea acicularis]|nr:MAG: hypothetical protein M1824_001986 [Vezdaea acicularis]